MTDSTKASNSQLKLLSLKGSIDFHGKEKKNTMEVMSYHNCLDILQNIFVCVLQRKEPHTGSEQLEDILALLVLLS